MIWGYHYFWKHPYKQIEPRNEKKSEKISSGAPWRVSEYHHSQSPPTFGIHLMHRPVGTFRYLASVSIFLSKKHQLFLKTRCQHHLPPPLKKNKQPFDPSCQYHISPPPPAVFFFSEPVCFGLGKSPGDSASEASLPLAAVPRPSASHQWHQWLAIVASFPSSFCEKSQRLGNPQSPMRFFQVRSVSKMSKENGSLFNGNRFERIIQRSPKIEIRCRKP